MDFESRFRVRPGELRLAGLDPADKAGLTRDSAAKLQARNLERLDDLQERLYAEGTRALLVVFQAMDAAGKDSTIEHVMSGVNPQGVRVTSFKAPSSAEIAHDWLWRCAVALPARGEIGIFNRSHYEEVLVVRVHPEYLAAKGIDPALGRRKKFWRERFEDTVAWERHLNRSGTRIVKFFLHVSRDEQRSRFLKRAREPEKHWKFSAADVAERAHWDSYMTAYEDALRATSTPGAPWYVIPADRKWLMRAVVGSIIVHHLEDMDPAYPTPSEQHRADMAEAVRVLEGSPA